MMLALESDEVKVGGPIPDEKVKLMVDFIGGGSSTPFRLYMHGVACSIFNTVQDIATTAMQFTCDMTHKNA